MQDAFRRIWVYPVPQTDAAKRDATSARVEILVLGAPDKIADVMVAIFKAAKAWRGLELVRVLVQGTEQIGITAQVSSEASHLEPDVEAMKMIGSIAEFAHLGISWRDAEPFGAVGTW